MNAIIKEQNKISNTPSSINVSDFRISILDWYDKHQRALPWRATQTECKNAYHTWLSEIMLQQTTVQAVIPYFMKFTEKWPSIQDLANANDDDVLSEWAGLGYYARARNLLKCARRLVEPPYNGQFPVDVKELEKLPGIGPYTAAAISSIAFDQPSTVVDGNIERVISRVFAITKPLPDSKKKIFKKANMLSESRTDRPGDYAQALMDLGATICTPKTPKCMICPIKGFCHAYKNGIQETLPKKKIRARKPTRNGQVLWIKRKEDGAVLFEKREDNRMLGGMYGLPGTIWDNKDRPSEFTPDLLNLFEIKPSPNHKKQHITHSFTHFHLRLAIYQANLNEGVNKIPKKYFWIPEADLKTVKLPTLFRKVVAQQL